MGKPRVYPPSILVDIFHKFYDGMRILCTDAVQISVIFFAPLVIPQQDKLKESVGGGPNGPVTANVIFFVTMIYFKFQGRGISGQWVTSVTKDGW